MFKLLSDYYYLILIKSLAYTYYHQVRNKSTFGFSLKRIVYSVGLSHEPHFANGTRKTRQTKVGRLYAIAIHYFTVCYSLRNYFQVELLQLTLLFQ